MTMKMKMTTKPGGQAKRLPIAPGLPHDIQDRCFADLPSAAFRGRSLDKSA
jgi:hypothetical protein